MKYSRFEMLIMVLGSTVIVGSMFLPSEGVLLTREVIAQLLIVGVLFSAAHWGRSGGFVAAVAATLVYVVLRIPLMNEQGLTSPIVGMIVTRTLTYSLIGIVGGEICGRIKYFFARIQGSPLFDESTRVYNGVFCGQAIKSGIGEYRRYKTPFSVAIVKLSPTLFADFRPTKQHTLLRATASHIRDDIRLVDDVGHLGNGEFMLLLPHTPGDGANVAADRVRRNTRDLLGARDESITTRVLSLPNDAEELCELGHQLDPVEPEPSRNPCEPDGNDDQAVASSTS
ncbi:MAG: hypothetical protein U1F44_01245 [Coriobacteriia bacterium]|nr:hypothetical protein [Coriobacteriia bacterium]